MSLGVVTKAFESAVKAVNGDGQTNTIDYIVSTESIDRDGEIILLSAWQKRLESYLKNPLLCWGHPVGACCWAAREPKDILGKSILTEIRPEGLFCRMQYAVDENDQAKLCYNLAAGGYLNSVSIGAMPFGPVYADYPDVYLNMLPDFAKQALKSGDAWCVHTDMELLEVSNVFVGSNRDALARAVRDGVISKSMMPDLCRQIQSSKGLITVSRQIVDKSGEFVSSKDFAELSDQVKTLSYRVECIGNHPALATSEPGDDDDEEDDDIIFASESAKEPSIDELFTAALAAVALIK